MAPPPARGAPPRASSETRGERGGRSGVRRGDQRAVRWRNSSAYSGVLQVGPCPTPRLILPGGGSVLRHRRQQRDERLAAVLAVLEPRRADDDRFANLHVEARVDDTPARERCHWRRVARIETSLEVCDTRLLLRHARVAGAQTRTKRRQLGLLIVQPLLERGA